MTAPEWIELQLQLPREQCELAEELLLALEASSVTLEDGADQPLLEPAIGERPLWDLVIVKGLFAGDVATAQIEAALAVELPCAPLQQRWAPLDNRDWSQEWKRYFEPIQCGQRLWICPSWMAPPQPDAVNLILDPGLAFGTGSHPTTHLCLRWLEQLPLTGATVIDYGCGSGILGIAALLLGAERVIAVDNDPLALTATADNADNNQIAPERIATYLPEHLPADSGADIVLANILAEPLIQLADTLVALLNPRGQLCLSGLLDSQLEAVTRPYQRAVAFQPPAIEQGWVQIAGTLRG